MDTQQVLDRKTVAELTPGMPLKLYVVLVTRKMAKTTRTGKPYWRLTVRDRSADITCNVWDVPKESIEVNDFVAITGGVEDFEGQTQINCLGIYAIDAGQVKISDFVATSKRPGGEMWREIRSLVETAVVDEQIRGVLLEILDHERIKPMFIKAPAAMLYHQAYIGGLAEHILSMAKAAIPLCANYEADVCMVLAGVILHDIGKTLELTSDMAIEYTRIGKTVGHVIIGSHMVWEIMQRRKVPIVTRERILHLIASHHGEFGDIKPQTREAVLLHHVDNLDGHMAAIAAALEADPSSDRVNVPMLKREVYR